MPHTATLFRGCTSVVWSQLAYRSLKCCPQLFTGVWQLFTLYQSSFRAIIIVLEAEKNDNCNTDSYRKKCHIYDDKHGWNYSMSSKMFLVSLMVRKKQQNKRSPSLKQGTHHTECIKWNKMAVCWWSDLNRRVTFTAAVENSRWECDTLIKQQFESKGAQALNIQQYFPFFHIIMVIEYKVNTHGLY